MSWFGNLGKRRGRERKRERRGTESRQSQRIESSKDGRVQGKRKVSRAWHGRIERERGIEGDVRGLHSRAPTFRVVAATLSLPLFSLLSGAFDDDWVARSRLAGGGTVPSPPSLRLIGRARVADLAFLSPSPPLSCLSFSSLAVSPIPSRGTPLAHRERP